jgi:hypothetical protein
MSLNSIKMRATLTERARFLLLLTLITCALSVLVANVTCVTLTADALHHSSTQSIQLPNTEAPFSTPHLDSSMQDAASRAVRIKRSNSTELVAARPFKATIASIFVRQYDLTVYYEIVKPAIELAVDHCNRRYAGHLQVTAVIRNDSRFCAYTVAPSLAAEMYYMRQVSAFVGPSCMYALDNVARLASFWNVPVFTAGGSSVEFNDKTLFSTLSRLSFSLGKQHAAHTMNHNHHFEFNLMRFRRSFVLHLNSIFLRLNAS